MTIDVGEARGEITPDRPLPLAGQMRERIPTHARDPLTANAVAFARGDCKVVIVSCDLLGLPESVRDPVQQACARQFGIPARHVLLAATHTHVGPATWTARVISRHDDGYVGALIDRLVALVGRALDDLEPCELHAGRGWLEHMGWNRRGLHGPGGRQADMYWGSWHDDFVAVEGPRDGDVPVLVARRCATGSADEDTDRIKAVVTGFATHPNCLEQGTFYSADLVGEVRRVVRAGLGEDVGFVYLTGAAGNTAPSILEGNRQNRQPWRGEAGVRRSGRYLGGEVLRVIAAAIEPMPEPVLGLAQRELAVGLRPWPASLTLERIHPGMREYFAAAMEEWPRFVEQTRQRSVRLSVLRLGEMAICFNPAELYVEHGLSIKAASTSAVTMVAELTDGYAGYVPTLGAFEHGGYSTWPSRTSCLEPAAGDRMVSATGEMLAEVLGDG